jgi:hypothetical protein
MTLDLHVSMPADYGNIANSLIYFYIYDGGILRVTKKSLTAGGSNDQIDVPQPAPPALFIVHLKEQDTSALSTESVFYCVVSGVDASNNPYTNTVAWGNIPVLNIP